MAVLTGVKVLWANVYEPDRKFEPQWSILAILNDEQKAQLLAESKAVDPKGKGVKFSETEDGEAAYRFRRLELRKKGEGTNPPPLVCGPGGKTDKFTAPIGNGSVCNIQYAFVPYDNKFGKGVTCDLKGVQVIEHVAYGVPDGDEFESSGPSSSTTSTPSSNDYDDDDFPS